MSSDNIKREIECLNVDSNNLDEKQSNQEIIVSIDEANYSIEDSYTNRIETEISEEFSTKEESLICIGSETVSVGRLPGSSVVLTGNIQSSIYTSSILNETNINSIQKTDSSKNLSKVCNIGKKDDCEMAFHAGALLANANYINARKINPTSVSFNDKNFSEKFDSADEAKSCDENEGKSSILSKSNTPVIMRKVTPVTNSEQNVKKCKKSPGVVLRNSSSAILQNNVRLKKFPPISVRKISPSLSAQMKGSKIKLRPKVSSNFKKLESQHSAYCTKHGKNKCDFVCSLYKSKAWTKTSGSDNAEISKFEGKRKSNSLSRRKVVSSSDGLSDGNNTGENCICNFCENLFRWEGVTCLKLDVPLPSSFTDPMTLLRHYGIVFSIPVCVSNENKNSTLVSICHHCYDLMLDGDRAYQKLLHIANQMRKIWAKQAVGNASFPLISEYFSGNDPESSSPSQECKSSNRDIAASKGKRMESHVRRQPFILPRINRGTGSVHESITKKRMTPKTLIEKPKKIRSKPLTCGLCGTDFHLEDQWEHHLENYHCIQQKWHRFTPNMHSKLRTLIINELIKSCNSNECNSSEETKNSAHVCCACDKVFNEQNNFVKHLREYHNMTVDDNLLSDVHERMAQECSSSQCENEESAAHHSRVMSDVEQILGNFELKSNLYPTCGKSKSLEENIMDIGNYGGTSITNEGGLLDNEYGQTIEHASPSKDFSKDDFYLVKRTAPQEVNNDNVTCLICEKKFKAKKDLEDHLEASHLTSIVLKGDGSGGVLDYNVDSQKCVTTIKKEEETSEVVVNGAVSGASELSYWPNENDANDLENHSLLENKPLISKSNEDGVEVPQRLVYECEICGRRITGRKLLHNHLRKIHNISMNLQEEGPLHYCKYCLFRSTSRALLEEHRKEKHMMSKRISHRQCETCGKIYSSSYIEEHVAVVHGNERKYTCDFCGMRFFDKKGVRSHIYYEHANKQWKCENCNLTFKKYHQLRQHKIYIHSTKEFKCDKCTKSFKRKGDLTEHMKRSHEKVYTACNYCPRQYRNTHKFRSHLINVHGVSKEDTYSTRYARHKRANNRLHSQPEKVNSDVPSDKALGIQEGSETNLDDQQLRPSLESHSASLSNSKEPEYHLVEVVDTTKSDLEMEQVTVLILS